MSANHIIFPIFESSILQTGYGVPTHIALMGSTYVDLSTALEYINKDGISQWLEKPQVAGGTGIFTGGTITGPTLFTAGLTSNTINVTGGLTSSTISATTYYGLPQDIYVTSGVFDVVSGTTTLYRSSGSPIVISGYSSGGSYFSGGTITGPTNFTAGLSACTEIVTNLLKSCSGDSTITLSTSLIEINSTTTPKIDATTDLGTSFKRFRNINTVSGNSTVWTSTQKVITPQLELGFDSSGNSRTITADNSVIQDDILLGGIF